MWQASPQAVFGASHKRKAGKGEGPIRVRAVRKLITSGLVVEFPARKSGSRKKSAKTKKKAEH